jgi:hypothetical protein
MGSWWRRKKLYLKFQMLDTRYKIQDTGCRMLDRRWEMGEVKPEISYFKIRCSIFDIQTK